MSATWSEFPPRRPEGCLSDLQLDRWIAGELPPGPDADGTRAHLGGCARCRAREGMLLSWQPGPPSLMPEVLRAPASKRNWLPRRTSGVAAALAMAAGLMVMVSLRRPPELERTKGGAAFTTFVRRSNGRVEPLRPGDRVATGDRLRFQLSSPQSAYALVIGLDGAGHTSLYAPTDPSRAPPELVAHRPTLLEGSIELDDSPGHEQLIALLCAEPPNVARVIEGARQALAKAGAPERVEGVGSGCVERTLLLTKGPPR